MTRTAADPDETAGEALCGEARQPEPVYCLDTQIGFLLRRAGQRHRAIFAAGMPADLTPRQWAVLAKLQELGPSPQNLLGRRTAMDGATIKGVVDRLAARGLVVAAADTDDGRRRTIALTVRGREVVQDCTDRAHAVTRETLAPLTQPDQQALLRLLAKIS